MPTYTNEDYQRISNAIGTDLTKVVAERNRFEGAVAWVRLGACRRLRHTPAATKKKLDRIRQAATKLLGHLGVASFDNKTNDLPPDTLLRALQLYEDKSEDALANAILQIYRLVEIFDAIDAARDLKQRADTGIEDEEVLGNLIVQKGHSENDVVNGWIAEMMTVYRRITGRNPTMSVGSPGSKDYGNPTGPFLKFLKAASEPVQAELDWLQHEGDFPVDFKLTDKAWRSRVRSIKNTQGRQKRI
jgi:hypothetical protein